MDTAPSVAEAMTAAVAQGSRVAVGDMTTPTRTVYAKPDGHLTAELSAVPRQVKKDDSWVPIDTHLATQPNGTITPKAAIGGLTLSGGGDRLPLARLVRDDKVFELYWPGTLPKPVVDGDTATYPEVLPGVDLRMRANDSGYDQHLVVKTAKAAANPSLARISLPTRTEKLTLAADTAGVLTAADETGQTVFASPPSLMWDAAGKQAPVKVELTAGHLVLLPDNGLLHDPAATFPVTVDPAWRDFTKVAWGSASSGKPNQTFWLSSADPQGKIQVGQCYAAEGTCNGIGEMWSYFQFDTGFLAGKRIRSSTLRTSLVYGPSWACNETRGHELHIANGQVHPGMTWNNRPQGNTIGFAVVPNVNGNCPGNKEANFPFNDPYTGIGGVFTFFLKAGDSNDQMAWRKYDPGYVLLAVDYNTPPNVPSNLGTAPNIPVPCRWCGGKAYIGDEWITARARLTDPDNDQLAPLWRIWINGVMAERWGSIQSSGAFHDTPIDLRGADGKTVDVWVLAQDHDANHNRADTSSWAAFTTFVVDRTPVTTAPTVDSVQYPSDGRWHGGARIPGTFTFGAAGVGDIDHYLYGWDTPTEKLDATALGGGASIELPTPGDGPRTLVVQSVDRAGHRSPVTNYRIYVRPGNGAQAQWSLDGDAKDSAYLGDRNGSVLGGAVFGPGAVGQALNLDGVDDQMTAPNTLRTDAGYSVSTWVKATKEPAVNGLFTAVSQDGEATSGFQLGYRKLADRAVWEVTAPGTDTATHTGDLTVRSDVTATLNTPTHLAAVYDAAKKEMRLYVNGVLAGSAVRTTPAVNSRNAFVIGHGRENGAAANWWPGMVDEVKAYDRPLTEVEVGNQVRQDNVQLGQWKFDETTGTTAINGMPGGNAIVLQGGARFVQDGAVNGAVKLEKPEDYAGTGGPVVRTDQSFAVATWVRLDGASDSATAVSQDDQTVSGFSLGYRNVDGGKWEWQLASDKAGTKLVTVRGDVAAKTGTWTHLTGVYDATAKEIRLYVDGALAGRAARTEVFNAAGELQVGRSRVNGTVGGFFNGAVDELRMYGWAIGDDEIQGLVSRDGVAAGSWTLDGDATDASGRNRDGALNGGPVWTGGQSAYPVPTDLAVQLDGVDDAVSAPHTVDTDRGFTVTAWARLDKASDAAVVSQDGTRLSGFRLGSTKDGKWTFGLPSADKDGAVVDSATGGTAQVGAWTHLVGVYQPGAKQIHLYVNGVLTASAAHQTGWNAAGGLQIGRGRNAGAPGFFLAGAVDDVTAYGRQMFATEIRALSGRDLSQVHYWKLDEPSGTNAADSIGTRPGALTSGASFAPGRVGNAVRLNGSGAVTTGGVDVSTDKDFTVTTWVSLDGNEYCDLTTKTECRMDAVSLAGSRGSKFRLGHRIDRGQNRDGHWYFEMPESDADGAQVTKAAVSVEPGEVSRPGEPPKWVHLTGVYDARAKQLLLYVDGLRVGDGVLRTVSSFGTKLNIGQSLANGTYGSKWKGLVDDVRIHSGAWEKQRVNGFFHSFPAESPAASLPSADAGQWKLDQSGADSAISAHPLTFTGNPTWNGGRNGHAVNFDGSAQYAQTAGPVLDTTRGFTVSSWVYLRDTTTTRLVLGQDGSRASAFSVGYVADTKRWALVVPNRADIDNPQVTTVTSNVGAALGDWVNLTVAYDPTVRQVRLYVNGALETAQVGVQVPASTGPFTIGQGKFNGSSTAGRFLGLVDDVRVFSRTLSPGEVRAVHDDVANPAIGTWRFTDGTGKDSSWINDATLSGGTSSVPGIDGKGLKLDGTGYAVSKYPGTGMRDSFTVSAWAKLDRLDQIQTVVGQDGSRTSGFVLQYRPGLNRWLFGGPAQDADGVDLPYATETTTSAAVGRWTHIAGVYDYPARQLRLYVDGKLAGVKDGVGLWPASGGLTIGRGKAFGAPAEMVTGTVDEVKMDLGVVPATEIAYRATWPVPAPGQLGRFVNDIGDRYTALTSATPRPGYRFEAALGLAVSDDEPGTHLMYNCQFNNDSFTSLAANCEGYPVIGTIGRAYDQSPASGGTAIYRCNSGADHFESRDPKCEGATVEGVMGYLPGYAAVMRTVNDKGDHWASVDGPTAGYRVEGNLGYAALTALPGTKPLVSCIDGYDQFLSLDADCGGKKVLGPSGHIWTQAPDGLPSRSLSRCVTNEGERFMHAATDCAGYTKEADLGFLPIDPVRVAS
nr:LamG domain-containing protein [Kibdelosporangium sp. MJ126-NF4]